MEISPSFRVNELENKFDSKAIRKKINAIYIISYNYADFMKGKDFLILNEIFFSLLHSEFFHNLLLPHSCKIII